MPEPTLSDRTWNLNQLLLMMQPGSALKLSDAITVKRSPTYWRVVTPHGTRQVRDLLSVIVLADGMWPCNVCGKAYSPDLFRGTPTGKKTECKRCQGKRLNRWYEANKHTESYKAMGRANQRRYRERHIEQVRAREQARTNRRRQLRRWKQVNRAA